MAPFTLFEVSWEVCNKVGGIHTVISTKAKTLVEQLGDSYVAVGPWLLGETGGRPLLVEEPGFEAFADECRAMGVPVRIGRWQIPGLPLTMLVEFSRLFERKDEILGRLWETHRVDSLLGSWDYVEPVLFAWAAGIAIEQWFTAFGARGGGRAVAQFHEWMTGAGMLYLNAQAPAVGTVFTTHATILGRTIAGRGQHPEDAVANRRPEELAEELGVRAKHSMESVSARAADVFTTVSDITAREAEQMFGRAPQPLLPNGIDLQVLDELAGPTPRDEAARALRALARRFLGRDVAGAALVAVSGRYEFHNKGIDLLLEALARLDRQGGRPIVLFVMVPAANSGVRGDLLERLRTDDGDGAGPLGIATHNLSDPDRDPVQQACARLGLRNDPAQRIAVIHVPIYFNGNDGLLNLPYEAATRAMDLTAFPSFYEPWGYTPEESLALGVPTITTDCSGFGVWVLQHGLGTRDGVHVIARRHAAPAESLAELAAAIEARLAERGDRAALTAACRRTAQRTAWSDLVQHYHEAFQQALAAAGTRTTARAQQPRFLPMQVTPTTVGQRPQLRRFEVRNTLPPQLQALHDLSRNLWWSWQPEAVELFAELSPKWHTSGHNPVRLLAQAFAPDLARQSADKQYVARVTALGQRFAEYLAAAPAAAGPLTREHPLAYFCAEYGLHESLPIYSGGLGILAGDHLKSASDLGLPLVAVGLFYRKGYLTQRLSPHLEQMALEVDNDPRHLPLELVVDAEGKPLEVTLNLPSSALVLRAWRVRVGRVDLYLLDSDVAANRPEDRSITHQLYGGDQENRLRQEIVLGRGGVRLLHRLGIEPGAWHLNEGHAAFAALERAALLLRNDGLTYDEARTLIRATTAFTSHTPIPAGHDRFNEALLRRYFSDVEHWTGLSWERFYALGAARDPDGSFNLTMFACEFAGFVNGVSRLHGHTTRELLQPMWPMLLASEVPVGSVTNGVHLPTWTHPRVAELLGAQARRVRGQDFAARAAKLDPAALWEWRQGAKRALRAVIERRLEAAFGQRHDSPAVLARMLAGLDVDALWLGFARRFVPYKRVDLLLRDPRRLQLLLGRADRPVRLLFAGKAHPHDRAGQELVHRIAELARNEAFLGKVLFLEDHDVELARALVQGVDVWLNTPLRPLEASGTSGMKAALNGVLNLSIADGWWAEACDGRNGWRIGNGAVAPAPAMQDEIDSAHLFRLLEEEVVPLWNDRSDGVPRRWLERAAHSMATIGPVFDSDRMVEEYRQLAYEPAARSGRLLREENAAVLRRVVEEHRRVRRGFAQLRIRAAHVTDLRDLQAAETIHARVEVELGPLAADDVRVELVIGFTRGAHDLQRPSVVELRPEGGSGSVKEFLGAHELSRSGSFGYGIRVRAAMREPWDTPLQDLVLWAGAAADAESPALPS